MGTGKKQRGKLVDMTEHPPAEVYTPPPEGACEIDEGPIDLYREPDTGDEHTLQRHARMYRGKVVYFSLEQLLEDRRGRHVLLRVDTAHGTVHVHKFGPDGKEASRQNLVKVPPQGHDVVDTSYYDQLNDLLEHWDENVRRWRKC